MRSILYIATLAILLSGTTSKAQQPINTAKLDSFMTQLESHNKVMCAVLIAKNGKTLYHREIGYEQLTPKKIHASAETEYRIGSISKMFTASIILQLIEEKKLTFATSLATFFPTIPNANQITIEEMLGHHSGIYDFTRDSTFPEWMTKPKTEDQIVEIIAKGKPRFAPGEKGEYCNSNFVLLSYIIERITKHSYADELEHRIAEKIGLKHTYYGGKIGAKLHEAASFERGDSTWEAGPESDMSIPAGAGAVVSTTADLVQFIDALFKGKVVSDSSLNKMMTIKDGYGLGMLKDPFYQRWSYGHNGHIDDFTSDLTYFAEDSMEFVVLCNGDDYGLNNVVVGVLLTTYNMQFAIPAFKSYAISAKILPDYEGTYSLKATQMKITVTLEEGKLYGQATGQGAFPLSATDVDEFSFEPAGIVMKFHRAESKNVDAFTITQHGSSKQFQKE
jgi:CubicO group peptidase (beta-lactamase class C family)